MKQFLLDLCRTQILLKSVSKVWSPRLQNLIISRIFEVRFKFLWKVYEKDNMNINRKSENC